MSQEQQNTPSVTDLGAVTAYGYAKNGGYTGTEAQYTQEQGQIATTAATASAAAAAAAAAKTAAESARDDAIDAKEEIEAKLSSAYVYGLDYIPSTLAVQKVVLNPLHDKTGDALRYTTVSSFQSMPAHNWRRCVMDNLSTRHVNYYLNASDSNKKADGTNAVLSGADGDVMVEIPITYVRTDHYTDTNSVAHVVWLVSDVSFPGARPHPFFYVSPNGDTCRTQYVGAFMGVPCDSSGNPVAQTSASTPVAYNSSYRLRSIKVDNRPVGNVSRGNIHNMCVNNGGALQNDMLYWYVSMMHFIEFASLDSQTCVSEGFVNMGFAYDRLRGTGRTAGLGNGSGGIEADDATETGKDYDISGNWGSISHSRRVVACSYRGIENLWGSQYNDTYGIQKNQDNVVGALWYSNKKYFRYADGDNTACPVLGWVNGNTVKYTMTGIVNGSKCYTDVACSTGTAISSVVAGTSFVVSGVTYTRDSSRDSTKTSYAWKATDNSVIYTCHLTNLYYSGYSSELYSDSSCSTRLSNAGYITGDYAHSGIWVTNAISKYSATDTNLGTGNAGSQFPVSGYTGNAVVWVSQNIPKIYGYYTGIDELTFINSDDGTRTDSSSRLFKDYIYNDTVAGSRGVFRGGDSAHGSAAGLGFCRLSIAPRSAYAGYSGRVSA